jgi:hypothetical protein
MQIIYALILISLLTACAPSSEDARLAELNAYWVEVSRSVKEGDFEAYKAGCHKDAVLVSGFKNVSYPLSKVLKRWKKDFDDTKDGPRKSSVIFRFSSRKGDDTTAHETGIFVYAFDVGDGVLKKEYINFEALLLKRDGWQIMMEYQKSSATEADWNKLKGSVGSD